MGRSVKSVWCKLIAISSLLLSCSLFANDEQADVGSWSFGVNLGLGQRSSFITGQDDVDILLLPNIHYYGDQLFFDNGMLGYTLLETKDQALSVVTELNPYGLYFDQSTFGETFNPLYLVTEPTLTSADSFADETKLVTEPPVHSDHNSSTFEQSLDSANYRLPKPSISLDFGVQHNWFISPTQSIAFKLVSDVSSKHSGHRGKLTWSMAHRIRSVSVKFNLGFDWLDHKSSNYYFGLHPDPALVEFKNQQYKLGSSLNPFFSVTANMPLTENIAFVSHFKYVKFDTDIAHSPITSKAYSMTHFAGIHYKFW